MEDYKLLVKLCMYIGPIFVILSVLCGLGYNHFTNKVKELNEKTENDTLSRKGAVLDFSTKQVTISRLKREGHPHNGSLGLVVYSLAIVNSSKEALTIKDAILEYDIDAINYSETALNLTTGTVWDKELKVSKPCLMFKINSKDTLYMCNWFNIRIQISKGVLLQPGEILQGSAFYLLNISNPLDFNKVKNLRVTIIDYLGNKTTNPILFEDNTQLKIMELIQTNFHHIPD